MKTFGVLSLVVLALAFTGCESGSPGGPGADSTTSSKVGKASDNSFTLGKVETTIHQGETKVVSIPIDRGTNFDQDVTLSFATLPKGITLTDLHPRIDHGATDARFSITAADDAALGDFSTRVTGHPTKGADAVNDYKISVLPRTATHE
jgi:hypothetical protein